MTSPSAPTTLVRPGFDLFHPPSLLSLPPFLHRACKRSTVGLPRCAELLADGWRSRTDTNSNARATAGDRRYCGEPVFVPRAGGAEGEGYIFTVIQDLSHPEEDRSQLEILDAADLESGPLATIALPDYVPPGLHGSWTSEYVGRGEDEAVPYSNDIRVQL